MLRADSVSRNAETVDRSIVDRILHVNNQNPGMWIRLSKGAKLSFTSPGILHAHAESSYSDFPDIARERIGRSLPVGTRWLAGSIVFSGIVWTRWRYGIDLRQTSSADAVGKTRVPVLLIHGLADNETSPGSSRRIAEANPMADLWLVPAAGHMEAWGAAPNEFESRVRNWFEQH